MQNLSHNDSSYQTAASSTSLPSRILPTFSFYLKFLSVVFRSAMLAKSGKYDTETWQIYSIKVLRALESVGVKVRVDGFEHLKAASGPVIFIGNHLSVMETVLLPSWILSYKPFTYVIKQSLLEVPVFKHVMNSIRPIAVTRTNPRNDLKVVLTQGEERLSNDLSLIIFPQTTRTAFDPEQFSTIGIKLAKRTQVPVIPLALLTDAWENGKYAKDFGRIVPSRKVQFAFGKPMMVEGKGSEEHQQVIDFVQNHLVTWQKQRMAESSS